MHIRLIFLNQVERTGSWSQQTLLTWQSKATAEDALVKRSPGKASTLSPYRKPTQVSGMSILRRVS